MSGLASGLGRSRLRPRQGLTGAASVDTVGGLYAAANAVGFNEDMDNCQAVIFDFFGTLVPNFSTSEHHAVMCEMARILGVPEAAFVERWLETFSQRATGEFASVDANIEAICEELGAPAGPAARARAGDLRVAYERRQIVPRADALQVLGELRRRGYKVGLITDCSVELPVVWETTEFSGLFDSTVFSCCTGTHKPDPQIYLRACVELGVAPQQCVYVGDGGSRELSGAKAVGMHSVRIFIAEEQGDSDAHRIDGEEWDGSRITALSEILAMLPEVAER